jgi:Spy/CpxP family protein refolding chaperone
MKTTLLSLITVLGLIAIVGCSNTETGPTEPEAMYTTMGFNSDGSISEQPIERPNPDNGKKVAPSPFVDLLRLLNLTPEQRPLVERLLIQHKECTQSCIETLRAAEREILMNAKIEENKIKDALKGGTITREVARRELAQLKKSTQEKLRALPREKVRECLKGCDIQFLNSLKEILTPEQKAILEKWILSREKRGTGPTDGGTGGGSKDTTNPRGRG